MNEKQEAVFDAIALDYRKAGKELRKLFESALDAAKELKEPEFNILDVLPIGSPVTCDSHEGVTRIKRIYAGNGMCYDKGRISGNVRKYKNVVPDPDAKNMLAFKVHDGGDCPVGGNAMIACILQSGRRNVKFAGRLIWDYKNITDPDYRIIFYSVIE